MREEPIFFPTSSGPVAGMVCLPQEGNVLETAVLLLTGDAHSRTRVPVLGTVGREMASMGYPTLRFDYPGAGLSAWGTEPRHEELAVVAMEAADWLAQQTGCSKLMTAGHCLGARLALVVAAYNEKVTRSVAVGCPIRRRKVVRSSVRAKLAMKEVGSTLSNALTRGPRSKDVGSGWFPGLVEEIETASSRGRIGFVYGSEDEFHADLLELLEELDPGVRAHVDVSVLRSAQLRALTDLDHHPWVANEIQKFLLDPAKQVASD